MKLKYEEVKLEILKLLNTQSFNFGSKLPTEFELMEKHGYSRNTIRQALNEVEKMGVIYKVKGKGTFFSNRNMKEQTSKVPEDSKGFIGLVNFYYLDYIYPDIMRGIEDTIYPKGYSLVMANCNQDLTKELKSVKRLIDQGIKALIFEPSRNSLIDKNHPIMNLINEAEIPIVTTHWNPFNKKFSMVTIDDKKVGREAVNHLVNKGHKKIAIIYREDVQAGFLRCEGYIEGLIQNKIEVRDDYILSYSNHADTFSHSTCILTKKLFTENIDPPTAIFYFNDHLAQLGYKALSEINKRVPDDVSIIGFDNIDSSLLMIPPLTTFEHPKYILGKWAANIILEELDSTHRDMPMKLLFEPVLIERNSVRELN